MYSRAEDTRSDKSNALGHDGCWYNYIAARIATATALLDTAMPAGVAPPGGWSLLPLPYATSKKQQQLQQTQTRDSLVHSSLCRVGCLSRCHELLLHRLQSRHTPSRKLQAQQQQQQQTDNHNASTHATGKAGVYLLPECMRGGHKHACVGCTCRLRSPN